MTKLQGRNDLPQIPYCEERHRLTQELLAASHELMELQNQQTKAIIDQDSDFSRFDDLIHMAREAKDRAKYALIGHITEHHC